MCSTRHNEHQATKNVAGGDEQAGREGDVGDVGSLSSTMYAPKTKEEHPARGHVFHDGHIHSRHVGHVFTFLVESVSEVEVEQSAFSEWCLEGREGEEEGLDGTPSRLVVIMVGG